MNSRLNLSLRENYGYVYSVESTYQPFSDTGFFGIYFGTEEKTLNKSLSIVHRELEKIRSKKLGSLQLHTAKVQAIGQMAMSEENYSSLMLVYGKSLLDHGKIDPLDYIFDQIRSTSAEELQEIAQEIFQLDHLTQLIYTPV